jgi:hypothetical protein
VIRNSCFDVYRGHNHMLMSICVCNSDTGKRKVEVICILNIVIYSNSTALYYGNISWCNWSEVINREVTARRTAAEQVRTVTMQ